MNRNGRPGWRRWLRLGGARIEDDVEDELAFHREMLERRYERSGLTREEARAAARERLGDLDGIRRWMMRHDRRRIRRLENGERVMGILNDVRLGVRRLAQQPAFTLAIVAVLALGTGATTAIFSAVDAVLLRSLPFQRSERLVTVDVGLPYDPGVEGYERQKSLPDITDARALEDVFSGVAAYARGGLNLTDEVNPRRLAVGVVTPNLFATLGVAPMLGRTFTAAEEVPGSPPAAILSERLWRSRFGGDEGAVGRRIVLNGTDYEVVGVMPRGFGFPEGSEVWVPLTVPYGMETMRFFRQYLPSRTIARLAPGATVERAGSRVLALYDAYAAPDDETTRTAAELVLPFRKTLVAERRKGLLVLLGATSLVLLVACANVANLLLSRATVRRREISLRTALGATPARVMRQLGIESLVLAAVGGATGAILAFGGIRMLEVLVPPALSGTQPLRLDVRVLAFSMAIALATGVVFGLWPALHARRARAGDALRTGSAGSGADRAGARLRKLFIVGEVALALMLLVGSTLMLRSLHTLLTAESGVDARGVATLELSLRGAEYPDAESRRRFYRSVLDRLAGDARVGAAAWVNELPLRGVSAVRFVMRPEGREADQNAFAQDLRVSPDYFRAMGIRVLAGRAPRPLEGVGYPDGGGAAPARFGGTEVVGEVAISESLARLYWPDQVPVGQRMEGIGGLYEIVGVVADVRATSLESEFVPQHYFSILQTPYPNAALVARGQGRAARLARVLEEAVHAVAPSQAVYNVRPMEEVIAGAIRDRRTNTFLIAAFGALSLLLSAVGVYGVMAYSVARRTREIGVRMALGASSHRVMGATLREGLLLALLGTALGLAAAWALSRVMEGMLYGVTARDPLTFVLAPAALLLVALGAVLLPALRATHVNPVEAMRVE